MRAPAVLAAILLLAVSSSSPAPAQEVLAPPEPDVTCVACLVVDDHGNELFARATDRRLANASTTKMVTALLVVRATDLDEMVTVSQYASSFGLGGLDLAPGERLTVEELLYALLLTSSNDAAVALAEHVSGSEEAFVDEMNAFAAELGATNTHFTTPHGLDRPGHYSSAQDLARMGLALLRSPALAPIVKTAHTEIGHGIPLDNRNLLIESYRGAVGIKTGFTANAGNVLVAAAKRQGRRLIAVVMDSENSFVDSARLLDYGFAVLSQELLVPAGAPLAAVVFDPSGAIGAVAAADIRGLPDPEDIDIDFQPVEIEPPVAQGDFLGVATLSYRGRPIATVDAVASSDVSVGEPGVVGGWLSGLVAAVAGLVGLT